MIREEKEIERGIQGGSGDEMRSGRKGDRENVVNGKNRRGGRKAAEKWGGFDGESWQVENRRGGGGWPCDEEEGEPGKTGKVWRFVRDGELEEEELEEDGGGMCVVGMAAAAQWWRQHDGILVAGARSGGGHRGGGGGTEACDGGSTEACDGGGTEACDDGGGGGWTPSLALLEQPLERENTPFFLQMTARVCGGVPSPLIEPIMG